MNLWIITLVSIILIYFIIPPTEFPDRLKKIPSSVNNSYYDIEKFSTKWNEPNSWAQGLHIINPTRLNYIINILKKQKIQKNVQILDLGCGGGLLTVEIAKKGFKNIKGVDLSPNSIKEAIKNSKKLLLDVEFKVGNAYEIPFKENSFDIVIVADVLEHLNDLKSAMKEINRILKKGGLIFFETIDRNFFSNLIVKFLGEIFGVIPKGTHDYKLFIKPKELENLFKMFNFQFIEYFGYKFEIGFSENYFPMIKSASLMKKGELKDLYIGFGIKN